MAEALAAIGAIASLTQLADFGFKLSIKLFAFGEAISTADRSVHSLSNEISLTSTVLKELSELLASDSKQYVSSRAVEATEKTVKECFDVFNQLSRALEKSVGDVESGKDGTERKKIRKLERIKWSFLQPRMDLLRSNLDRLKSSLALMLQVLAYARDTQTQKAISAVSEYQKATIESLARSAQSATHQYHLLQRTIGAIDDESAIGLSRTSTAVDLTSETPTAAVNLSRGLSSLDIESERGSNPKSPEVSKPHTVKPRITELIICFNLVQHLLNVHLDQAGNGSQYRTYLNLRRALESAHAAELEILEKYHGDRAYEIGSKASKHALHLLELLRSFAAALGLWASDPTAETPTQAEQPHDVYVPTAPTCGKFSLRDGGAKATWHERIAKAIERGERLDSAQARVSAGRARHSSRRMARRRYQPGLFSSLGGAAVAGIGAAASATGNVVQKAYSKAPRVSVSFGTGTKDAVPAASEHIEEATVDYVKVIERLDKIGASAFAHWQDEDEDEEEYDGDDADREILVEQLLEKWTVPPTNRVPPTLPN